MTHTKTVRERIREEASKFKEDTIPFEDNEADIYIATGAFEDGARFGFNLACEMLVNEGIRRNEPDPTDTGMGWAKWLRSKMKEEKEDGR